MEVWTLSVEGDAAVLVAVLYDNIPSVATLIRSIRPDPKDSYHLLVSARRLACAGVSFKKTCGYLFS